jgi:drug/metabolite transporter (DMT)-like permease
VITQRDRLMPVLVLALLGIIWGFSFVLIKVSLKTFDAAQTTFLRLALGALSLGVVLVMTRSGRQTMPTRTRGTLLGTVELALLANVCPYLLLAWGERHVAAAVASVAVASTPAWTYLATAARAPSTFSTKASLALTIGFIGVILLFRPWTADASTDSVLGTGACLLAAISYALYYIRARSLLVSHHPSLLWLSAFQLAAATVIVTLILGFSSTPWVAPTVPVTFAVIALGVVCTGLAYILSYYVIRELGPIRASSVNYIHPVVTVVLGIPILAEAPPPTFLLSVGLTLGGVWLLTGSGAKGRHDRDHVSTALVHRLGSPGESHGTSSAETETDVLRQ